MHRKRKENISEESQRKDDEQKNEGDHRGRRYVWPIDKGITKIAKHVEELFDEPVEVTEKIFMKKPDDNPETIIPLVTHHDDVRNGINFHRKHNKKKR